jgi:hypothetical protein
MIQTAQAGTPTHQSATATATILTIASNRAAHGTAGEIGLRDRQSSRTQMIKHLGPDGHLIAADHRDARVIVIFDLP